MAETQNMFDPSSVAQRMAEDFMQTDFEGQDTWNWPEDIRQVYAIGDEITRVNPDSLGIVSAQIYYLPYIDRNLGYAVAAPHDTPIVGMLATHEPEVPMSDWPSTLMFCAPGFQDTFGQNVSGTAEETINDQVRHGYQAAFEAWREVNTDEADEAVIHDLDIEKRRRLGCLALVRDLDTGRGHLVAGVETAFMDALSRAIPDIMQHKLTSGAYNDRLENYLAFLNSMGTEAGEDELRTMSLASARLAVVPFLSVVAVHARSMADAESEAA